MITRRTTLLLALASPAARADSTPSAPISAFARALLDVMKQGKSVPFATRAATLRPAVEAAFDLESILKTSVGVRWAAIAPPLQAQMLDAFRDFTIATWVANFDTFDGERIDVAPETRTIGADVVVTTRIVPRKGEATRLDYQMRQTGGIWRAVDILVDGTISRVAVQRSDFRAVLAKGEQALLELLRTKAAELAAGAK